MHEIHGGSDFRLHDDYGITLLSMGQRLMFVFSWAHCGSTSSAQLVFFSLALPVIELRAIFFVSWQYVYIFECFPVVLHWISKEASTRSELFFLV